MTTELAAVRGTNARQAKAQVTDGNVGPVTTGANADANADAANGVRERERYETIKIDKRGRVG